MSARRGDVRHGSRLVGTLTEDARGNLLFAYHPDWLDDGFPISLTLPLANGDRVVDALSYFEGLLPEGRVRARASREHGVDESDVLGLLLRIGADCAGALTIAPEGQVPELREGEPVRLSDDNLRSLVQSHGERASSVTPRRFSLAGAQEKLTVVCDDRGYAYADRRNPSSHILKFETVPHVCMAEALGNAIFQMAGLPVVETEFLRVPDVASPYLRIRRYDREVGGDGRRRLHQEDLIQAVGEISIHKYESEGGPSLAVIASVLREHVARPADAIERLRDWQILNFLVGNSDAHGKNLALLYRPGSAVPDLAPFYDVVAIEFLNLLTPGAWARDMAFAIGGEHVPERIGPTEWQREARALGLPPRTVLTRLQQLATELPSFAEAACTDFTDQYGAGHAGLLERFIESVRKRCRWALRNAGAPT